MLEYSEYKDIMSILDRSNNDSTYSDLMKKETKVLDTINTVVKEYKDRNISSNEFLSRSISINIALFWQDMNLLIKELFDIQDISDIPNIFIKGERVIYFGFICIFLSIILFFIESSK